MRSKQLLTFMGLASLFSVMSSASKAQVGPGEPETGCQIRYDYDAAGNRTSRYWYCWGVSLMNPNDTTEVSQKSTPQAPEEIADRPLESMSISLAPNPAHDQTTVMLSLPLDKADYFIMDMQGKILFSGSISGNSQIVDIRSLAPGQYHFSIVRGMERLVKGFVVQ
ncbi:MAG: T9SS type A sorting domain-containing protein [Flavobacteriales bacterium]|jgi:hypothetical protein|nr:T9SS type A sorting domain-containing protein [Flavobacteriales bacterium]